MPDLTAWAVPFFRAFGILVKVHLFFFVFTIGLFLRQVSQPGNVVSWIDILLLTVVVLFISIVLHEFGHCFGGRAVGGEASQVLIWPLGGLAYVEVPHQPRAHFIMVLCGPLVNLGITLVCSLIILVSGYFPNFNPLKNPYISELHTLDGKVATSIYGPPITPPAELAMTPAGDGSPLVMQESPVRTRLPHWLVWVNRIMWLNWSLFLFNLIPAYPLDGGQLLQSLLWHRLDYRRSTTIAAYTGIACAVILMILSIMLDSTLLMALSIFILFTCVLKLQAMEREEGIYGDFSQGYTSLDREDAPPPRPARPNFIKRWLQARAARRIQKELEERQQDEERMDQLLDKINKFGKGSLTAEEQKFMERVSARYRNR